MGCTRLVRVARWGMLVVGIPAVWAQSLEPVAAVPATAKAAPVAGAPTLPKPRMLPDRLIRFSVEKPVLGLPLGSSTSRAHCSTDGITFFDLSPDAGTAGASATQVLYSISHDGEVKHLLRKVPVGFSDVSVSDFFAGERVLATLLEADQRADGTDPAPPRERDYFLSLSDEEGDLSSLVQIQMRFRPVKIARFGSGDSLVLGWDEGNLLPVLALLRDDGTIRRFVDFDERRDGATHGEAAKERVTLDALQGATFVAYGSEVLLTYPGTTKAVRVLSSTAEPRTIPMSWPPGYVLRDVLPSSAGWTLVARVRPAEDADKTAKEEVSPDAKVRMFEFDSTHGSLLRELRFDKPAAVAVTCAANSSLTALFYDTLAEKDRPASAGSSRTAEDAKQLVVATTRR